MKVLLSPIWVLCLNWAPGDKRGSVDFATKRLSWKQGMEIGRDFNTVTNSNAAYSSYHYQCGPALCGRNLTVQFFFFSVASGLPESARPNPRVETDSSTLGKIIFYCWKHSPINALLSHLVCLFVCLFASFWSPKSRGPQLTEISYIQAKTSLEILKSHLKSWNLDGSGIPEL